MVTRRSDAGFSVIELMVAMALLLVALAMFGSVLFTVQQTSNRQIELGRANDQARLAIQEIDRQLRSGYVTSTGSFTGADASARIYTEARMSGTSSKPTCVAWVLHGAGSDRQTLYTKTWDVVSGATAPAFNGGVGWRVVATDIVNTANGGDAQTFGLETTSLIDPNTLQSVPIGQSLTVTLWLNPSTVRSTQVTQITTTLTSRNIRRSTANAEVTGGGLGVRYNLCG